MASYQRYKKSDGTYWMVAYYDKQIDGTKKQRRKRGFKTKKEAVKWYTLREMEMLDEDYNQAPSLTYHKFIREWFETRKKQVSINSMKRDETFYRIYVQPVIGDIDIDKIDSMTLQKVINDMCESLESTTIHTIGSLIKLSFDKAVKLNLIKSNPMLNVDLPKVMRKEMKVWDNNQIKRFIKEGNKVKRPTRYYIGGVIALLTGMRRGEILGLRWKDVDFDKNKITIRQTMTGRTKEIKATTKTKSGLRTISVSNSLVNILKKEKVKREKEKESYGEHYEDYDLIVCTQIGRPVHPDDFVDSIKSLIKKLDLPMIRFHDFRHSHASLLIEQNIHPKLISERLGHANIGITLDIYAHVLPSMQQEVADKLDDLFTTP